MNEKPEKTTNTAAQNLFRLLTAKIPLGELRKMYWNAYHGDVPKHESSDISEQDLRMIDSICTPDGHELNRRVLDLEQRLQRQVNEKNQMRIEAVRLFGTLEHEGDLLGDILDTVKQSQHRLEAFKKWAQEQSEAEMKERR